MSQCIDFPCCGHESGCCPSFDDDGRQIDMKCTCGASVPLSSRSSICESCFNRLDEDPNDWDHEADPCFDDDEEDSDDLYDSSLEMAFDFHAEYDF